MPSRAAAREREPAGEPLPAPRQAPATRHAALDGRAGLDPAGARALHRAIGNEAMARLAHSRRPRTAAGLERQAERGDRSAPLLAARGVRIHDDAAAAAAARALGARAFTVGRHVYLGGGENRPGDPASRRLLRHELVHVAQQEAAGEPSLQLQTQPDSPAIEAAGPHFRSVDPSTLGHGELLSEIATLRSWIRSHDGSDPLYEPAVQTLQELQDERVARVRSGATWLGEDLTPSTTYALVPGGPELVAVDARAPDIGGGRSSDVATTPRHFDRGLDENRIPRYELNDAASVAALASRLQIPGFEAALPRQFASPVSGEPALRGTWTGNLAELHVQIGRTRGIFVADLNRVPWGPQQRVGNFPLYDVRRGLAGELLQVKASTQARQSGRFRVFEPGFLDIAGVRRPQLFGTTAQTLFPDLPPTAAEAAALEQGRLVINLEDVPAFRERMASRVTADPSRFRALLDLQLAQAPVEAGGQRFTSLAQLDAATGLAAPERARVLATAARGLAAERVSGHMTGTEIANLQELRRGFGTGRAAAPQGVVESQVWPELLMAERAGGGARGTAVAMGRSSVRGGGMGGIVAVVVEGGVLLIDPAENPDWAEDLATTGGLGVLSGAVGAGAETGAAAQLARWGIASGASGRAWVASGRGLAGGAGGGMAAPVFEIGRMALSEQEYSATDYAARGSRAAVSGFLSGALAAATVGAIFGSSVPLVGTALGFVVGFLGYVLVDSLIGDAVEGLVRDISRELSDMRAAVQWGLSESPGSFFVPMLLTPLGARGGPRGLLNSPADTIRRERARQAAAREAAARRRR